MALPLQSLPSPGEDTNERRLSTRRGAARPSVAKVSNETVAVTVVEVSSGGCKFRAGKRLDVGSSIIMGLSGAGSAAAEITWREGFTHGCRFLTPLAADDDLRAFTGTAIIPFPTDGSQIAPPQSDTKWPRPVRTAIQLAAGAGAWLLVWALLA